MQGAQSSTSAQAKPSRLANYDLLRVVSTLAVMAIHVNFLWFSARHLNPSRTVTYLGESFLNTATRFCVPCFVMLSGAFLLPNHRNADARRFYEKTARRVYLPTLMVMALLCCHDLLRGMAPQELAHALAVGNFYNFWYLYMLLGLYAMTPVLVRVRASLSWHTWSLGSLALLAWASATQPSSSHLLPYDVGVVGSYLGYFLVGDVLREEAHRVVPSNAPLPGPGVCGALSVALALVASVRRFGLVGDTLFSPYTTFFEPDIAALSICVFWLFSKLRLGPSRTLSWLSARSFSVYLVHSFVYQALYGLLAQRLPRQELVSIGILLALTAIASLALATVFDALCGRLFRTTRHQQ